MRIISGSLRGKRFYPPKNIPARPTTDFAKEALFNILNNTFDFSEVKFWIYLQAPAAWTWKCFRAVARTLRLLT
jgi:16S rRNA G966 N2-methylase RsmD